MRSITLAIAVVLAVLLCSHAVQSLSIRALRTKESRVDSLKPGGESGGCGEESSGEGEGEGECSEESSEESSCDEESGCEDEESAESQVPRCCKGTTYCCTEGYECAVVKCSKGDPSGGFNCNRFGVIKQSFIETFAQGCPAHLSPQ